MRCSPLVVPVLISLFIMLGCKKSGDMMLKYLPPEEQPVVGTWAMFNDYSSLGAEFTQFFGSDSETDEGRLVCRSDKNFEFTMDEVVVKGRWSYQEGSFRLSADTIDGKAPADVLKDAGDMDTEWVAALFANWDTERGKQLMRWLALEKVEKIRLLQLDPGGKQLNPPKQPVQQNAEGLEMLAAIPIVLKKQ